MLEHHIWHWTIVLLCLFFLICLLKEFGEGGEAAFLQRLGLLAVLEETGDWGELWSPSAVLNSKQLYVNRDGNSLSLCI